MPIPCLRLGLALVLGCTAFLSDARAEEDAPSPGDLLRRAEAFYWLGITDQSNTRAFGRGLALVKEAKRLLEPADPALPPQRKAQRKLERQRAEALQEDLTAQLDVSTGRFYDVYPLVRVIGPALVGTVGAPGRYDTDGPPDVVAATTAAGKLADKVLQVWRGHPQLHVVLRTAPSDDGRILNEVLYHLGSNPRLVIHPPAKIAPLGSTDDPVTLLNALNVQHLLVVTIQRKAVLPSRDLFFYGVEGQLYRKGSHEVARSVGAKAITLWRRNAWFHTLYAQFALLLLAVATGLLLRRPIRGGWVGPAGLVLVAGAFLLSRTLVVVLAPLLTAVAPEPERLVRFAWWWPAVAGIVFIAAPVTVIRLLLPRLARVQQIAQAEGNLGFIGGAAGLGTAAFLAGPMAVLEGSLVAVHLAPLVFACWALGYLFGAALDSLGQTPAWAAVVAIGLAAFLGSAACMVDPLWLWTAALVCAVAVTPCALVERRTGTRIPEPAPGWPSSRSPRPPTFISRATRTIRGSPTSHAPWSSSARSGTDTRAGSDSWARPASAKPRRPTHSWRRSQRISVTRSPC